MLYPLSYRRMPLVVLAHREDWMRIADSRRAYEISITPAGWFGTGIDPLGCLAPAHAAVTAVAG